VESLRSQQATGDRYGSFAIGVVADGDGEIFWKL
jgi:hypothetical protein